MLKRLQGLAGDSLVYGLAGIFTRFVSVWLTPIYTRLLTQDDYGSLSLINVTIALVQATATLALDAAAIRWFYDATSDDERRKPFATWACAHLASASVGAALLVLFAVPVSRLLTKTDALAPLIRIAAMTLPLSVSTSVALTWMRVHRRAWPTVAVSTGTALLQIGMTFLLVVTFRGGLRGILIAQVVAAAIGTIVAVVLARSAMTPRLFDGRLLRVMLAYGAPLVPAGIAAWVVSSIDRFFVQRFVSTAEVGIFSIGMSIASLMTLVVWAFQQAWSPFALQIHREEDANATFASVFLAYTALGAFAVTGLALFAPLAIRLLATPAYDRASLVVGTLAMSFVLTGVSSVTTIGYIIARTSGPTAIAVGVSAVVTIALNAVLVPSFGIVGSAVATLVGQAVQPAILMRGARRAHHIPFPWLRGSAILGWAMVLVVAGETVLPLPLTFGGAALRTLLLGSVVVVAASLSGIRPAALRERLARARAS